MSKITRLFSAGTTLLPPPLELPVHPPGWASDQNGMRSAAKRVVGRGPFSGPSLLVQGVLRCLHLLGRCCDILLSASSVVSLPSFDGGTYEELDHLIDDQVPTQ